MKSGHSMRDCAGRFAVARVSGMIVKQQIWVPQVSFLRPGMAIQLIGRRNHILAGGIIMKVFAIGSFAKTITDEERQQIMRKEVPDTLKLYLEGRVPQVSLLRPGKARTPTPPCIRTRRPRHIWRKFAKGRKVSSRRAPLPRKSSTVCDRYTKRPLPNGS